jgi:hypothetical protein
MMRRGLRQVYRAARFIELCERSHREETMSAVNGGPQLPAYDNPDAIIEASILRLIRKC